MKAKDLQGGPFAEEWGYALVMKNKKDSPKQRRPFHIKPIDHPHVVVIIPQGHSRIVPVISSKKKK